MIGEAPRRLEAVLHEPPDSPRGAVAVCHPHPQYGGDMESNVVVAVARRLAREGFVALRFNFGGVGASEGAFDRGGEEQRDVGAAVTALARRVTDDLPIAIVGYSFGGWVGAMAAPGLPRVSRVVTIGPPLALLDWSFASALRPRVTIVAGDRDQFCPADALGRFAADLNLTPTVLRGADHFFGGREVEVAAAVVAHLTVQGEG